MEISFERTERTYIRLILGSFAALALFVLVCWGGFRVYRHWQERHLVRRAVAVMSGGDLKTASLAVQRVLQLNPDNLEANRLFAEILEKAQDRGAIELRRKVYEANPGSVDDALAYVRASLWFNDDATAEKTLGRIAPLAQNNAAFHAAAGRLAEMRKQLPMAEASWARAVELAPNDHGYRLQLSLTRLSLNDPAKREQALRDLEELRAVDKERAAATRTLIVDGIAHGVDPQIVRRLASELENFKEATFADRLMYLEILRQLHDAEFDAYLSRLKTEATASAGDLAALLAWMMRSGLQADALDYANSVPSETLMQWPVPLALAEARSQMKDWPTLEKEVREANWGEFNFLRRAYLARALRGQSNNVAAEGELAAAQKEAAAHPQMISILTQTIGEWGWQDEAIEMLWTLTKNPETKMSALRALYQHYASRGDTPGLYRTLTRLVEANPADSVLQNNLAQVSLLIGADLERARKLAAEVSAKEPENGAYQSTHAFALLLNGDAQRALQVMNGLREDQLREPGTATYYGIILAAVGDKQKAREYLQRSAQAQLLPEEKALVAKAESSLP